MVNGKVTTKREQRRRLIGLMLTANPPKKERKWVTDHHSYIISVGKLYDNSKEDLGHFDYHVPHPIAAGGSVTNDLVRSKLVYEGNVNMKSLGNYVKATDKNVDRNYDPGEDLKSLNIISWYNLHKNPNWPGGLVRNKFYPAGGEVNSALDKENKLKYRVDIRPQGGDAAYLIRSGFFTSIRPGDGTLLMNVNTTTSAFYPSTLLSEWLLARWGNIDLSEKAQRELKGLRVTFEGERNGPNHLKQRAIWSIPNEYISNISFKKNKASISEKVVKHLRSSKLEFNLLYSHINKMANRIQESPIQ